jgi:hypothetical protein
MKSAARLTFLSLLAEATIQFSQSYGVCSNSSSYKKVSISYTAYTRDAASILVTWPAEDTTIGQKEMSYSKNKWLQQMFTFDLKHNIFHF